MKVYLDNAATTPIDKAVLEAMLPFMKENFGNPSSIHSYGRVARAAIENARKTVAKHLNASTAEIFFTSCGTESNNMAIRCAIRDLGIKRIISSPIEHHCVLHTLEMLEQSSDVTVTFVNLDEKGNVDYNHLDEILKTNGKRSLVSLMHANNEIGTSLDMERVGKICRQNKALFHSDSVQTMGHFQIDTQAVEVDFLTGSAHKFHGPKGVGFLYVNSNNHIKPMIYGGSQERNMRAGTENIYGIVGLAKAFDIACSEMESHKTHVLSLKNYLRNRLTEEIPDVCFNGEINDECLYTVLNVSFPSNFGSELLLFNLDIAGIAVSGGSACSSGADAGSHVLNALKSDPKRKSVRFSFSKFNTIEEIDFVMEKLKSMIPATV